jgi:hypothetical protein
MIRSGLKAQLPVAAVAAVAAVALLGVAPPATAFTFGSVAGNIDNGGRGLDNYPRSIRYNNLLFGAPIITTKDSAGAALRRVRVGGIITKVRIKVAYNGSRSFKFSLWQPDNSNPRYPGTTCRNNRSPQQVVVTTSSADCVMEARMVKQGEVNFVQANQWPAEDPSRSRFNSTGNGYARVVTQDGPGAGRPTVYTFANARAAVREDDWLSVAPVESDPQWLQAWRSGAAGRTATYDATNNIKMAADGGLCMHGQSRTPMEGRGDAPGGEGIPGRGGVMGAFGLPRPPIETGELNVGMAGNQNPVSFSPCYPTFQYQGYNSPGGNTGLYYGNCHPDNNFAYNGESLSCLRAMTNAMQVEYTIEADRDHDGWGDETQGALALRERAWLAADAERRARAAADAAERERLAEIARRWRVTPLGVDVTDLLREGAALNIGEIDFNLGGIAPGAQPGESPAEANPGLVDSPAGGGDAGGEAGGGEAGGGEAGGGPAAAGPQLTVAASTRKRFGSGAIPVRVRCPKESCQLVAEATMRSRSRGAKRSRSYAMNRASYVASRVGKSKTMFVKLSASNRRKLRSAWRKRSALSARVTVSAVNAAGGVTKKAITVNIRRPRR